MKRQLSCFTLYSIIVYLTLSALNPTVVAHQPPAGNGADFGEVIDWQPDNRHYARTFANLNIGEPRTVRLFYLLPNDRPYRAEVVADMKTGIREMQNFFAEQMAVHGHGAKTFQFETDAQGDPVVHRLDTQHPDSAYSRGYTESGDLDAFDNSTNVALIVMDISRETYSGVRGSGTGTKKSGWVIIYREWNWNYAAHELGHAFGLHHDFRDDAYLLSYGGRNRSSAQLSACAAEFLAVHPYFNSAISLENESPPTVELISPTEYPAGAESVPIRLRVRDADGLHQVILFVNTKRALGISGPEVKAYRELTGETDTIVEFNYDGKTPSDRVFSGSPIYTSFSDPLQHRIYVVAVDTEGNRTSTFSPKSFTLEAGPVQVFTPVSERTPQVRDAIVKEVPGINSAADVTEAHLAAITVLDLGNKHITSLKSGDFDGLTSLEELILYGNQLTILPEDIFDGLIELRTLRFAANRFTTLPGSIFDGLTKLTDLGMVSNQFTTLPEGIFDGLTGLTRLRLGGNAVYPLPLTVSLEKVGADQFKTVAPAGAPFDIVLPISVTNGSVIGVTTITIPAGSVESGPLTVTRYPGTTAVVSVNIGTLPWLPFDHGGYSLVKSGTLPLTFTEQLTEFLPISNRTPQVRDLIVLIVRARFQQGISAADVTAAHLRSITSLDLRNKSITSLKASDFFGMPSLEKLILDNNSITSLPEGVFDGLLTLKELWLQRNALTDLPSDVFEGLSALERLQLSSNALTGLPEDVFEGLSNLTTLDLSPNSITSLPEDVFEGLSTLKTLFLRQNELTSLPEDVFDGLSNLTSLELSSNALASLPEGVFDGLSNLTSLSLSYNALTSLSVGVFEGLSNLTTLSIFNNPQHFLSLTLSLEKVGERQFKAVAPTGAPFNIILPLTVTNGSINGGAASINIPAGSVESEVLTVTRPPGTTAAITVDIGAPLPRKPLEHYGYTLVKSDDLPLEVIGEEPVVTTPTDTARQDASVNIPDANLRAKIETALSKASGDPISPAEMATLTSLTAQDASISNLTGLETATNLTTLKLGNNTISNISALTGLTNLTELQLWDNQISNISALSGLTNLTQLLLWGNTISDISPVAKLTNLTRLYLGENAIANISAVSELTNLTHLYLNENSVSDISAVARLTNLTELRIGDNTVSNISAVANLTNLVWLDARNNTITDISAVMSLTNLTTLTLTNNTITDISPTARLTKLVEVFLNGNSITDISPLVSNTGLGEYTEIDVQGNPLSYPSIYTQIPALQAKNVYIDFDNRVATAPVKISGDTQQGNTGTVLAQPFVVEVQDANSVAFAGVPVTFAVTAGGGRLSATSTTTDVNGRTQSTLTLGNTAGTNTVRASVQGISASATFTATATTTNTAPAFTAGSSTTRTIAENTAANVNIGTPVAATDADNDALTYTLGGTDASAFSIERTTGQLKTSAALDYETKRTYIVTLTVSDGTLTDTITVTINVTDIDETPVVSTLNLLSGRTPQVRDAIVAAVPGVNSANDVTEAHLAAITSLNLSGKSITSLTANDFSGLSSLTQLYLHSNQLTTLPDGVFAGLSSLTRLNLRSNQLTTLPDGVFAGLSSLTQLYLYSNQLTTLPDGVFAGLSSLTRLNLLGNTVAPLPLTASLEKVGEGQFKAVAPTGAPFDIVLPINVTNGSINGGATTTTISKSSVESDTLRVSRTPGTTAVVTVDIGNLPGLPSNHQGYQLAKSTNLPLEIISLLANSAPVFTESSSTTRFVTENTATGVNIGVAIAATDADNDALTYTLSGTDAASFSIVRTSGQLRTRAALDYETKRTYTVTITVSDGSLADTITVTINVTNVDDTPVVSTLTLLSDRTPEVRDAIVRAIPGVNSANDVTEAHLKTIISLDLNDKSITSLKAGDFAGLSSLRTLYLNGNQLTSLPSNLFLWTNNTERSLPQ